MSVLGHRYVLNNLRDSFGTDSQMPFVFIVKALFLIADILIEILEKR